MPSTFKPFESYFQEMGQPAGSPIGGTDYDLSGDMAPAPDAAPPAAPPTPKPAAAPAVNIFTGPPPAAQSTGPAGAQTFGAGSPPAPTPKAPGTPTSIALNPFSLPTPQDGLYGTLFGGIGKQAQATQKKLGDTTQAFTTAAGPSRSYESVNAPQGLERALSWAQAPPGGDPGNQKADKDAAMGLLGASYGGPQGLEQGAVDSLSTDIDRLGTRVGSLRRGAGATDLLRSEIPGLTMGQTRVEAQRLLADPEYRKTASAFQNAIRGLGANLTSAEGEAQAIAAQRGEEESEISRLSREYLTGSRGGIDTALDTRLGEAASKEELLDAAFKKFKETGSLEDLSALDKLSDLDFSGFNTDLRKLDEEGEAAWAAIQKDPKWTPIQDVPLMVPGLNAAGRETLWFPPEWWKANQKKFPKKLPKNAPEGMMTRDQLKALARERQIEFEKAGFSPGTASFDRDTSREPGKFAYTSPLYFTGQDRDNITGYPYRTLDTPDFEPGALNEGDWIRHIEGSDPTRDAMASAEERRRYNAIQELLGEAGQIQAVDPYQGATLESDMDRYIAEQQADYDARKALIEKDASDFKNTLGKFKLLN